MSYDSLYEEIEKANIYGLGEKNLKRFRNLGLETVFDVLYNFPRTYEDRTNIKKIRDLREGEYVLVKAKIFKMENIRTRTRKTMFRARVGDDTGFLELVWFQMPYLKKVLEVGKEYVFIGKVKRAYTFQMVNAEYREIEHDKTVDGSILPVYSVAKGMNQNWMRKLMYKGIEKYGEELNENIPEDILGEYKLIGRREALRAIHFPKSRRSLEEAKRRFAVEELLILEFGILSKRFENEFKESRKYKLKDKKDLVKNFLDELGFNLTKAQKKVVTEIYKELVGGKMVNRLIQGDVGSGKTVVAIILLLYMVENSYQGVIMAPTEILAAQHYLVVVDVLNALGVRVEILTGSVKGKKREKLLAEIREGVVDIVVGTHALIEDSVEFKNLGLIVIDEQHRFGVVQRKKLRDKGVLSNLIVMSATPIPRSLALSIYGDLDVSIIDELPPGRKPIKTRWIKGSTDKKLTYDFIEKKLSEGRQAYFVAPLIEESEALNAKSAIELYQEVSMVFGSYNVGLLHGRMKNSEKEEIMRKFKKGGIDILVSTTVIEVGVNIPNASIMLVSDAHRFGLSSLHQLRGRVGRGEHASYCFLISETENDISRSRLRVMETTTDGFKIAEEDLRLRKSGEIFGTRQSGISDLKLVDIVHDVKTVKLARDIAIDYLKKNNGKIENPYLKMDIEEKFKEKI